nr:DUF2189 domain-containing protein [Kandeliimicrobium roseum]
MVKTIGNPLSWTARALGDGASAVPPRLGRIGGTGVMPETRRLTFDDLRAALRDGWDDFAAFRTDVMFACLLYPVIGLVLAWFAFHQALLPLLFPLVAGFALLGPVAAIGLYEMSRRRVMGLEARWSDGFALLASPSLAPIVGVGAVLFLLFLCWLGAAGLIYEATLGPALPASAVALVRDALTTTAGWTMIVVGFAVGFVFAAVVLAVSVVSLPLLVDRDVGLVAAIVTSVRVAKANPKVIAAWGLVVAVCLALGSLPALIGLIVAMPVLGHATWHLYRRAVVTG